MRRSVELREQPSASAAAPSPAVLRKSRRYMVTFANRLVMTRQAIDRRARRAMALDAPAHLQARRTCDDVHRLDSAVAVRARDVSLHVCFMTEPHEARNCVHLHPANWRPILPVAPQFRDFR